MKILILYTSQTGTTKYVSEIISKVLETAGHTILIHNPQSDNPTLLQSEFEVILLGAPTYEDGKLYQPMIDFLSTWKLDFSSKKIGIFGLGSTTYPLFCKAADILGQWVKKSGGSLFFSTLRVDGFPDDKTPIEQWANEVLSKIS